MTTTVSAATKAPTAVLGKIVGVSAGKIQQVPEEPTEQEIQDYAVWLGLDTVKDRDLFWIARQALRTPIPQPWVQCQTVSGDVFFHNTKTKEKAFGIIQSSPARIVSDFELPDEPVVESAGRLPSQIIVSEKSFDDDQEGVGDGPAGARDLLKEIDSNGPDQVDVAATEESSADRLFEPPPRSAEAGRAELAELRLKIEKMEMEEEKIESELRDSERHREKLREERDTAAELLNLAEAAREEAMEALEREKEARQKAEAQLSAQAASNRIIVGELTEQLEEVQAKSEYLDSLIATQTSEVQMLRERLTDGREKVRVLAEEDAAQRRLLVEKDMEVVNLNRALALLRQQIHVESKRSTFSKLCGGVQKDMADTILHEDLDASVDAPEQNKLFDQLLNRVLAQPPPMTDRFELES
ncbi:gliding-associated protein 45, putative [Perkinsus marinus ATCC 50983]|uniref:Gliding-associated protein 45, putative n=1 Tax=Perkinsus marinus (strain ATCC 50983 / TXsc) TaxID=423536 RepID=C5LVC5_PERM5|nr:gliding-associated protein 45, putative [Perkinsus marinus ATCC 50983]EEQ99363.1 gliding-associated protein 45, putative [Perkinsus marinus ATCC 50983]|eukprot:XP_002766646.1 gliding-associated protein 45, putative [Perkinsus marinus ATCC 50983]